MYLAGKPSAAISCGPGQENSRPWMLAHTGSGAICSTNRHDKTQCLSGMGSIVWELRGQYMYSSALKVQQLSTTHIHLSIVVIAREQVVHFDLLHSCCASVGPKVHVLVMPKTILAPANDKVVVSLSEQVWLREEDKTCMTENTGNLM